jgi:soluble cytochrome b562
MDIIAIAKEFRKNRKYRLASETEGEADIRAMQAALGDFKARFIAELEAMKNEDPDWRDWAEGFNEGIDAVIKKVRGSDE